MAWHAAGVFASTSAAPAHLRWLERDSLCHDADPVVFLHGRTRHMHDWDDVLDVVAIARRAVAPELPFIGEAPTVSLTALVRQVLGALDALDIRRAVLGGHSLGGLAAIATSLAAPERVSGLIVVAPSRVCLPYVDHAGRGHPIRSSRVSRSRGVAVERRERSVPVLIVSGTDVRMTPRPAGMPDVGLGRQTFVVMPGCRELPMVERPALFGWTVLRWLAQHS